MNDLGRRRGFRSWFVEPYRQVKLGLVFLLINMVFSVLILGVFGHFILEIYGAMSSYFRLDEAQSLEILQKLRTPLIIGGALVGVFVLTTILASVRYTHDIYGPLVSIRRYLDGILAGEQQKHLQLRESDQLKELAEKLNELADRTVKSSGSKKSS